MKKLFKKLKVFAIVIGIALTTLVTYSFVDNDFELAKNIDIFATVLRELNTNYVDDLNPGQLVKTGIDAMLESLDPYTNYISEADLEDYKFMTTGQYGGVGAMIHKEDKYVVISEVYENCPAYKAGIMAGDKIIAVNDNVLEGKSTDDVSKLLKGQAGSEAQVKVLRDGEAEPLTMTLKREIVKINNIPYTGMVSDDIGYINLSGFTQDASKEMRDAVLKLKENPKLKGIIFDLRGNGGGLLNEAVDILNIFLDKDEQVVSTKGKIESRNHIYRTENSPTDMKIPLVVLVDGYSASASEIVSGSIQDLDRGVIIGHRTFGKGLVQNIVPLTYNTKMKVTIAKYYIPSGRCIQALDYAHKNAQGKAIAFADSLQQAFKTRNGRTVYDGKGIKPDIEMEQEKPSNIAISLVSKFLIFDYATKFRHTHNEIPPVKDFVITDEMYSDFMTFIADKKYDYTTETEKQLETFKDVSTKDKYFDKIQTEYNALYDKVIHNKNQDLVTFKDNIKLYLKREIASRYYYQKGRIEASLYDDSEVKKAIDVLHDKTLYNSLLAGAYQPKTITTQK